MRADTSDHGKVTGKEVFHNFFGVGVFVLVLQLFVRAVIMHSSDKRRRMLVSVAALILIKKKSSAKKKNSMDEG